MRQGLASVVVGVLAGCGRVGFEPASDAGDDAASVVCMPVDHDEDGDGVDDACDGCPIAADPDQTDSDGDGVTDTCDPNPNAVGDRIAFFDPFTSARPEWSLSATTGSMLVPDAREVDARMAATSISMSYPLSPGLDTLVLTGRVLAGKVTAGQRQITLGFRDPPHSYVCELNGDEAVLYFNLTYSFDGMSFTTRADQILTGVLENHDFKIVCRRTSTGYAGSVTWPPEAYTIEDADPGTRITLVRISANGVQVQYKSMLHVHTE